MLRKSTVVLLALFVGVGMLWAADASKGHSSANRVEKMRAHLNLTDEQAQNVAAAFDSIQPRMEAVQAEWKASHETLKSLRSSGADAKILESQRAALNEIRENRQQLHAEIKAAMQPILSTEQLAKWQAMMGSMKAAGHGHGGMKGSGH
ncbi:MAG: hypothetical protein IH846_06025 [Acidobacteria bacterium]|nr:hypothetical protein [Acidobacteriota bacterium]